LEIYIMKYIRAFFLLFSIASLAACGSDDDDTTAGTGGTTTGAATISSTNSQDLAIAATESTKQGITADSAGLFGKTSGNQFDMQALSEKLAERRYEATTYSSLCTQGGSVEDTINASAGNATLVFTNCAMEGVTLNGTMTMTTSQDGTTFTLEYTNFSVMTSLGTETVDFTMTCDITTGSYSCTTSSSINGIDGRTYTISGSTVTGNSTSGYNVTAEVVDPEHGTISINAANVLFDCADGRPSTGTISFSAGGSTGTVTFDSCTAYTVTINGSVDSYTW
jgi:hypothetical protein